MFVLRIGGGGGGGYGGGGGGYGGGGGGGQFGPTGHDYRRDVRRTALLPRSSAPFPLLTHRPQDDGQTQVDETKVNSMLAERLQAKMTRDFVTADRIRDELRAMGVEVYDKEKTWKAGGGGGGGFGGGSAGGGGGGGGGF